MNRKTNTFIRPLKEAQPSHYLREKSLSRIRAPKDGYFQKNGVEGRRSHHKTFTILSLKAGVFTVFLFLISAFLFTGKLQAVGAAAQSDVAVTYYVSKGRFGDQLLGYLHAKWISYYYGFPLLYKPFLLSEEFALHEKEELWTPEKEANFDRVVWYSKDADFLRPTTGSLLYVIPFFSDLHDDVQIHPEWPLFSVGWKDEGFCRILREMFAPLKELSVDVLPQEKHYLTVALHVRRGGGVDVPHPYLIWPLRFAPNSYYIECLDKLCMLFPDRAIYAYVFTDDLDPKRIILEFQNSLAHHPITFACREKGNRHGDDRIKDFFGMMHFDCLIRSASNFSLIPSMVSDYKVVMTPKHSNFVVKGFEVENYIDQIDIEIRSPDL